MFLKTRGLVAAVSILVVVSLLAGCRLFEVKKERDIVLNWVGSGHIELNGKSVPKGSSHTLDRETLIELRAIPDGEYVFSHWRINGDVYSEEDVLSLVVNNDMTCSAVFGIGVDNGEDLDSAGNWLAVEKCSTITYTDEFAYEGDYSIKVTYDSDSLDWDWAVAHNHKFLYEGEVYVGPGTLRFMFFNPVSSMTDKLYLRVTLRGKNTQDEETWWWPPGWGASQYDEAGNRVGFSGSIDGSIDGEGWYTYEAPLPYDYSALDIIQIKLNFYNEEDAGERCIYIDKIEIIPDN